MTRGEETVVISIFIQFLCSFVTENEVGADLIHPDDIGVKIPEDEGPWRLASTEGDQHVMLLRFGRKTDMNTREKQVAARHVGILSKSRREELLQEQEKALQKEAEKKAPVDKRNPWGSAAQSWARETRGRMGTDFEDFLDAYTRDRERRQNRKDWDNPGEDHEQHAGRRPGGIRDRLGWSRDIGDEDNDERGGDDDEMEWVTKMKKPRMGMVADMVETKSGVRSRVGADESVRRKDARRSGDAVDSVQDLRQRVTGDGERVIRTAGRRLQDRFAGGRLEGRLGQSSSSSSGLRSRLGNTRNNDDGRDSLERDMGEDLQGVELVNNMVIRVTRNKDDDGRDRSSSGRGRDVKTAEDREKEIRQRLKEIKREKDLIDDEKRRQARHRDDRVQQTERHRDRDERVRYDRDETESHHRDRRQRDEEKSRSLINQIRERASKSDKYKSKRREESSDESESDSSESDESESDSSDESESEESESSDSDSSSSSDSEDEQRRRRDKRNSKHSSRSHGSSSKHSSDKKSEKKSKSSSKRETEEELKKAAELRDQLRNYLKKAKEAKEKKKK